MGPIMFMCRRRNTLAYKKNTKARLTFPRENINKDQDFWNNKVFRIYQFKVVCKLNLTFPGKQLIPTGEWWKCHGWAWLAAAGFALLTIKKATMNSIVNQRMLEMNVRPKKAKQDNIIVTQNIPVELPILGWKLRNGELFTAKVKVHWAAVG